ncbi:hypothetical protein LZ023_36595 (plasmid) [Pseudomonas silvicola]|nr:hypothetical protein LZ023_36595 [Pseudomonas silvicola]
MEKHCHIAPVCLIRTVFISVVGENGIFLFPMLRMREKWMCKCQGKPYVVLGFHWKTPPQVMSFTKIPKLFAALSDETIMNFKKLSLVLFGTFFSLSSFASEMSDVSQSVMPIDPRCNISVGDSAIDFGMLSRGQLQRDNKTFSPAHVC